MSAVKSAANGWCLLAEKFRSFRRIQYRIHEFALAISSICQKTFDISATCLFLSILFFLSIPLL